MKNRILILVPFLKLKGGVASYYQALKPYLPYYISYFTRGGRGYKNMLLKLAIYLGDIVRLIIIILIQNPRTIVINTSLGISGLRRDSVFIRIAHILFKKQIIVFFRGWNNKVLTCNKNSAHNLLTSIFLKSEKIIVLSNDFKKQLIEIGYRGDIIVETTTVDKKLLNYKIEHYKEKRISLLFLARIEREKGVFEVIKAFELLLNNLPDIHLDIAGEGSELENLKNSTTKNKLKNIVFHGHVSGEKKARIYAQSTIYIFPSYHEGMPNSVLEAMAFGIPIITTRVGGVNDFFINKKMGLFLETINPEEIRGKILYLLYNPELRKNMGDFNKKFARERFLSNIVARRFIDHINAK